MSRFRITSVNILGIAAVILMIVSMFFPWWSLIMMETRQTDIYPYIIDGPITEFIGYKRSPQMTALMGALVFSMVIALLGSFIRGIWGRILLILGGLLSILGAWRLFVRVAGVAAQFDIPVQGSGRATYGGFAQIEVASLLRPGVYIIIIGGAVALLAGLLNNFARIGKKPQSSP